MNHQELAYIANELDSNGMYVEADILDRVLVRYSQLLNLKEKPFLSKLAEIVLRLMEKKPGEMIQGSNLVFPGSKKRLSGMTREDAIQEVRQHLEAFINQYLLPLFEERYVNTQYEKEYSDFIDGVRGLVLLIDALFEGKIGKGKIQQGLSAISQTRKMFNLLLVNQRIQRKTQPDYPDATKELDRGQEILSELQVATQKMDEQVVREYSQELAKVFPTDIDEDHPLFNLVFRLYPEQIPFIQQGIVASEVEERLDEEHSYSLQKASKNMNQYKGEFDKNNQVWADLEDLEKRWQTIKAKTQATEADSVNRVRRIPSKEFKRRRSQMPHNTFEEPKMYEYVHTSRRLDAISRDVEAIQEWAEEYALHPANVWMTFSQYLSRGTDKGRFNKIVKRIDANIAALERTLAAQQKSLERKLNESAREYRGLKSVYDEVQNRVVWDLWHHEYIDKLIEMLGVTLTSESSAEGQSTQAFRRLLKEFRDLLNYEL